MKKPKWYLRPSKDGQFYFTLSAPNGETILTSEMYTTKAAASDGIKSIQANAQHAEVKDLT